MPGPLRSGRASFPASGLSKPCWLVGGQKCRVGALVAAGVCETAPAPKAYTNNNGVAIITVRKNRHLTITAGDTLVPTSAYLR